MRKERRRFLSIDHFGRIRRDDFRRLEWLILTVFDAQKCFDMTGLDFQRFPKESAKFGLYKF